MAGTGLDLTALRNTALSYFLSGRMPREFGSGHPLPARPALEPSRASPRSPCPPRGHRRGGGLGRRGRWTFPLPDPVLACAAPAPMLRVGGPPPRGRPGAGPGRPSRSWPSSGGACHGAGPRGRPGSGRRPGTGDGGGHRRPRQAPGRNNPCLVGRARAWARPRWWRAWPSGCCGAGRAWEKVIVELSTCATLLAGTSAARVVLRAAQRAEGRDAARRTVGWSSSSTRFHTLVGAGSTGEGAAGRCQRAEGRDGPGRVPLHRGHHPRRVPAVHPGRRGAGAALHPGGGERAVRARDRARS